MTEREIRNVISEVCAELDRRARALLVPSLVGAGLVLGAGGCADNDKPPTDSGTKLERGPAPLYAVPSDLRIERGTIPPYMAPDVAPPQPEYIAPGPDGGMAGLYSAPGPDLK